MYVCSETARRQSTFATLIIPTIMSETIELHRTDATSKDGESHFPSSSI